MRKKEDPGRRGWDPNLKRLALTGTLASALVAAGVSGSHGQSESKTKETRLGLAAARAGARPDPARVPHADDLAQRIAAVSVRYLGTTYVRDPLGEGPGATPDPDPLFCRAGVDCQTFVEQVLAEAIARRPAEFLPLLTRIRYRNGVIGFGTRNHYMVSDWLPQNRWLIRDLTGAIGGSKARVMEKVIDRAAFFQLRGAPELGPRIPREVCRTLYIPRASLPEFLPKIPSGAVLIWVQDRPGIIAAHCGFALRREDGMMMFRHASERRGHVLDEPLCDYLQRAPARIVGVKVCQAVASLDTARRPR